VNLFELIWAFSATSDVIHQAQFALDVKAAVLPLYEKVFDVEYPLPKLDTLVVNKISIFVAFELVNSPSRLVISTQELWRTGV
jgi:hypothetical protein